MAGRKTWQHEHIGTIESGVSVRVAFDRDRGRKTDFLVQLEVLVEGRWRPVVRYDTAHGQAHRDLLAWNGRVVEKTWMPSELDFNRCLSVAEHDVTTNARTYIETYEGSKR